jgi:hypothetical protein
MATQHPDTFEVADMDRLRKVVQPGVFAKICVLDGEFQGERIWTKVVEVDGFKVKATLANEPFGFPASHGDPVTYQLHNIYNVSDEDGEELA